MRTGNLATALLLTILGGSSPAFAWSFGEAVNGLAKATVDVVTLCSTCRERDEAAAAEQARLAEQRLKVAAEKRDSDLSHERSALASAVQTKENASSRLKKFDLLMPLIDATQAGLAAEITRRVDTHDAVVELAQVNALLEQDLDVVFKAMKDMNEIARPPAGMESGTATQQPPGGDSISAGMSLLQTVADNRRIQVSEFVAHALSTFRGDGRTLDLFMVNMMSIQAFVKVLRTDAEETIKSVQLSINASETRIKQLGG